MKFVFPFATYTDDKLGIQYVTLSIPSNNYTARHIRRTIGKVVKKQFGAQLSKAELHTLYKAGLELTHPLGAALNNAENQNVVLEGANFHDAVAVIQGKAEKQLELFKQNAQE